MGLLVSAYMAYVFRPGRSVNRALLEEGLDIAQEGTRSSLEAAFVEVLDTMDTAGTETDELGKTAGLHLG